jgi:hypothetical protein
MELDITRFFNEACPMDYSASRAELGQDAGKITWNAAVDDAAEYEILPDDKARDAFRDHVRDFGAWDDEEIAAWSNDELNALCMQMVAGDIREMLGVSSSGEWNWTEYEQEAEKGRISSNIYQGDDGRVYYYIGS